MKQFNEDDVIKVAKALFEDAIQWDNGSERTMNPNDGYQCNYCQAGHCQNVEQLTHDTDCPVLIAQDLLT